MRNTSPLGAGWRYTDHFEDAFCSAAYPLADWSPVDLPHTNRELPFNGFDEHISQFVSSYARDLELAAIRPGERVFLDFDGVMAACELWINGKAAGSHRGGYTPFSIEITEYVHEGQNRILVKVDSTERADIPPFGHVVDYLCYGGIYRGVFLRCEGGAYIRDVYAKPLWQPAPGVPGDRAGAADRAGTGAGDRARTAGKASLSAEVTIDIGKLRPASGWVLKGRLLDDGREIAAARASFVPSDASCTSVPSSGAAGKAAANPAAQTGSSRTVAELDFGVLPGIKAWEPDSPKLYTLEVAFERDGAMSDLMSRRIGFRSAEWKAEGFFLNGRLLKIRGLNRHQSYPYEGYAMPARAQRRDAEILKNELGLNLVRTSHYPDAPAFLDACDELGLLVFEELPGWQHIGGEEWQDQACADLESMIVRDRSRPSVVLWGVRINESQDCHDFYIRTNGIAEKLDPARARGGVRYIAKSELLEDVYTFNDFNYNGILPPLQRQRAVTGLRHDVPFLITEFNGHMFPTKRFDNEERLAEQARRHAKVLDAAMGAKGTAGAIGWCAFDYNTHKDFGSGDRICYHGVSDMFRIPKWAAAVYASQKDASAGIVLEPASIFAKGERSAAQMLPLEIYTNCDEIVLFKGGNRIGTFKPDHAAYPHLRHPPVIVRDLIGDQLDGGRFSHRDVDILKAIVSKVLIQGMECLSKFDLLRIALLLKRNHMTFAEGTELVSSFVMGWGAKDETWQIAGMLDGKEVLRRSFGSDAVPSEIRLTADEKKLEAGGEGRYGEAWDCVRIVIRLLDQYGNLCPYVPECVDVSVSGPARILGPQRIVLQGGCAAFWVRPTGAGAVTVACQGLRAAAEPIQLSVE